jgi:hypothetical protein
MLPNVTRPSVAGHVEARVQAGGGFEEGSHIMAHRKSKETYAQQVVGLATAGLPAPVQKVAKSKLGSKLLLLLVPILIATGVISISWSGGLPSVTVNRQRAAVVGEQVKEEALRAAERVRQYGDSSYR